MEQEDGEQGGWGRLWISATWAVPSLAASWPPWLNSFGQSLCAPGPSQGGAPVLKPGSVLFAPLAGTFFLRCLIPARKAQDSGTWSSCHSVGNALRTVRRELGTVSHLSLQHPPLALHVTMHWLF